MHRAAEGTHGQTTRARRRVSLLVLLKGKLTDNGSTIVACQDLAAGSGPRGSTTARPGFSYVASLRPPRGVGAPRGRRPRKPRSAHPNPTTSELRFWGAPPRTLPLQSPFTLISLASSATSSRCHPGAHGFAQAVSAEGGGESTPTAHALGTAPGRRRRSPRLSHWPVTTEAQRDWQNC